MRGRIILFGLLVVLLLSTTYGILPLETEGIGPPVVTIEISPEEEVQVADIRPGEHGTVTFPCYIEAEITPGGSYQDVVVDLYAECDMSWPTVVNPETVTVQPGGDWEPFSVTVSVPPETSYYISSTVTIGGTASPSPGAAQYSVSPVTGTIKVAQFYKYSLECDEPTMEAETASRCLHKIKICNSGNGRDTYTIKIVNQAQLTQKGFTVNLGAGTIEVDEKSYGTVSIQTEVPDDNNCIGSHLLSVEVRSTQQEDLEGFSDPVRLDITMKVVEKSVGAGGSQDPGDASSGDQGPLEAEPVPDEELPGFGTLTMISAVLLMAVVIRVKKRHR